MHILRSDLAFPPPTLEPTSKILFVDIDDTVRMGHSTLGYFVNTPNQVKIFPQALRALRYYKDDGYAIFGITNQGGIAEGFLTEENCIRALQVTHERCSDNFGNIFDAIVYCPHSPNGGCSCRKPRAGMIYRILGWDPSLMALSRESILMVGDRHEDRLCASAAGIPFLLAQDWWKITEEKEPTE